ncbi:MAG: hypothetical protein ACLUE8_14455 [Lachnospiraceae bacterium]
MIGHSANTGSVAEGLLGYGCYWTAEYKGQYVSMLTEEGSWLRPKRWSSPTTRA